VLVSEPSPLRQTYDAVERTVAPPVTALSKSSEAAGVFGLVTRGRRFMGRRVGGITAGLWHLANLPARSDVQRLRVQIGELDREVRRLSLHLELEAGRRLEDTRSAERSRGPDKGPVEHS
jgi:hypothetical protein